MKKFEKGVRTKPNIDSYWKRLKNMNIGKFAKSKFWLSGDIRKYYIFSSAWLYEHREESEYDRDSSILQIIDTEKWVSVNSECGAAPIFIIKSVIRACFI